jgi:uncharacterized protein YlxP (DUF503 family)
MVIGICTLELYLPGMNSLKDKRSVIKSVTARLNREFNISAAEVGLNDVWQSSTVGVAVVTTAEAHAEQMLENVVSWLERNRPDVEIVDYRIETIHL